MEIQKNNIYNMDCVDGMKLMIEQNVKVDCVLTSPPYNTARNNKDLTTYQGRYDVYIELQDNEEYLNWTVQLFNCYEKILSENGKVLYNLSYGSENTTLMSLAIAEIIKKTNFTLADIIVWEKHSALPNNVSSNKLTRICEFVYVFCRKNEFNTFTANKKVASIRGNGQKMYENIFNKIVAKNNDEVCPYNKATYSTELCNKLLSIYCKRGETIFDSFMGTGTTAISAIKMGMNYIGFELSEQQYQWAKKRIDNEKRQVSIFDIL